MNDNIKDFLINYLNLLTSNIQAISNKRFKTKNEKTVLKVLSDEREKLINMFSFEGICLK